MKIRTTMPTRGKLIKAYKNGDEFRKYVLLYGIIKDDKSWEHDGDHWREYRLHVDGLKAHVRMCNGEVTAWGYGVIGKELIV